ncbi:orotate phosphoribosyltransferase [Opitutia bacterium ISCC 51]|nr:orotate phosphoribosyltransferase [Opitutae bacterium ISCC 51]QXD27770.1 orotate phosphoribosyltransferase [Opitutae bacterium ISCC 52]
MDDKQQEILTIFEESKALLRGHFILRSGLRSSHFFQCARVCEYMDKVERLAEIMLEKLEDTEFTTVLAPAMGGLVFGQEVARQAKVRYIFAEKQDDKLVLRRGFKIEPAEKVLIVEDVITRGGRAQEAIDIVRGLEGDVTGLALLADRSAGNASFDVPVISLAEFNFPTYNPESLPPELEGIPAVKPGS